VIFLVGMAVSFIAFVVWLVYVGITVEDSALINKTSEVKSEQD
jgi:hypothetical protein